MADAVQHHRPRAWYLRPPVWILGVVLLGLAAFGVVQISNRPAAILYGEFLDQLDADNIASVTFAGAQINGNFKRPVEQPVAHGTAPQMVFRSQTPEFGDPTLLPELRKQHVSIDVVSSSNWLSWLGRLPWPMVLIIGAVLIVGLVRLRRGKKASPGAALPTHPMMGLISGLFGKKDQAASRPVGEITKAPPNPS